LAIDKDGRIFLLEVNPKPAREVFARIGERSIYYKAITQPLEYALWVYRNRTVSTPNKVKVTKPVTGKTTVARRSRKSRLK
jgi:hypothetical protein